MPHCATHNKDYTDGSNCPDCTANPFAPGGVRGVSSPPSPNPFAPVSLMHVGATVPFRIRTEAEVLPEAEAALAVLEEVPFFQRLLSNTERWIFRTTTIREYCKQMMVHYLRYFYDALGTDPDGEIKNTMLLYFGLQCMGKMAALQTGDPIYQPMLTRVLVQNYSRILRDLYVTEKGLFEDDYPILLIEGLVREDPFNYYLRGKIPVEEAVLRIKENAGRISCLPSDFCDILEIYFQCEWTLVDLATIHAGEPEIAVQEFNILDQKDVALGEMPEHLFRKIFALEESGGLPWARWNSATKRFDYAETIADNINNLKAFLSSDDVTVDSPPLVNTLSPEELARREELDFAMKAFLGRDMAEARRRFASIADTLHQELKIRFRDRASKFHIRGNFLGPPGIEPINEKQYFYLRSLKESRILTKGMVPPDEEIHFNSVKEKIKTNYGVNNTKAEEILFKCLDYLENRIPATITIPAEKMFLYGDLTGSTHYLSTFEFNRREVALLEAFIPPTTGGVAGPSPLGEGSFYTYVPAETYAERRGGQYMRWRRNKDDRVTAHRSFLPEDFPVFGALHIDAEHSGGGENYYGSYHLLLKPHVKTRAAYSKGTGDARRSMLILMDDYGGHENEIRCLIANAYGLPYQVIGTENDYFFNQPFFSEIHVYGPVRWNQDIQAILVPQNLMDGVSIPSKNTRKKINALRRQISCAQAIIENPASSDDKRDQNRAAIAAWNQTIDELNQGGATLAQMATIRHNIQSFADRNHLEVRVWNSEAPIHPSHPLDNRGLINELIRLTGEKAKKWWPQTPRRRRFLGLF